MIGRKVFLPVSVLLILFPIMSKAEQEYRITKVGKSPNFLALSADGKRVYATSFGTNEFLEIDISKRMVIRKVLVGESPLGFALAEQEGIALIACKDAGSVSVVDLKEFKVVYDVNIGGYPNAVSVSPRGYRAFVTDYGRSREGSLHVVDIRERRVVATIKMGASPFTSVVSPVDDMVYVVVGGDNQVWVVDPEQRSVVRKIDVGQSPDGIAITPDGRRVFVANSRSNDLSVIDAQMMRVLITIPVGKMPFGVDVSPDGKRVFVVNSSSKTVSILPVDFSSLEGVTFNVDKGPTDIAVAGDNRTVFVINELSNSIVVADIPLNNNQ